MHESRIEWSNLAAVFISLVFQLFGENGVERAIEFEE